VKVDFEGYFGAAMDAFLLVKKPSTKYDSDNGFNQ